MRRGTVVAGMLVAMSVLGCSGASSDPSDFVEVPGIGTTRIDVPRATSPGGATTCTPSFPADDTIAERALALRDVGLFADRAGESDAAFAAAIEADVSAAWGSQIPPDDLMDLVVAERDPDRTWWHDLEADVVDENQVYVTTVEEWAAISLGDFEPADVSETWATDSGPVTVAFSLDGQSHELHPAYLEDWIDPTIIGAINAIIAPSGRRFEIVKAFDQTAFVLALTQAEREALEARGWCFE